MKNVFFNDLHDESFCKKFVKLGKHAKLAQQNELIPELHYVSVHT